MVVFTLETTNQKQCSLEPSLKKLGYVPWQAGSGVAGSYNRGICPHTYTHEVHTTEQYLELLVRKGREGGRMDCARLSDERFLPWKTKHCLEHQKGYEASLLHASFQLLEFSFLT